MNATEIISILLLLRVVLPVGLLLWIGENVRRRASTDFQRISGGL
jgi:hypothetical protein